MYLKAGHIAQMLIAAAVLCSAVTAKADMTLKISFPVEQRYESNYLRNPKGSETDDYVSVLKPGVTMEGRWKSMTLTGSYLADIEKVAKNSQFDHTAHSLSLEMEAAPWSRTGMTLRESASYTPNAFDVNTLSGTNVLTNYTDIFYSNTYGTVHHAFTDSSSLTLSGEYSVQDFSDPALVDTITYSGGLSFTQDVMPRLAVQTGYEFTRYSFERGGAGTSDVHIADIGLKSTLSESLTLELSGGIAYTPGVSSSLDIGSDLKWIAGALLRKDYSRSSYVLEYARGVSNAGGISSELNINDTVTVVGYTSLTDNLSASLTGIYAKQRSAPDRLLDTNYYSAALSGSWRISGRFSLSAGYSHYEQQAAESSVAEDIAGDIVYLKLSTLLYENRF